MEFLDKAVAFDLETTGVRVHNDQPVSYALVHADGDLYDTDHSLVIPEVPISPGASEKHGITMEQCLATGVSLVVALEHIRDVLLSASRAGTPLVGMNLTFDLTIVDHQLRINCGEGLEELGWHGPIVDAYVIDRYLDKYRKGKRTLTDLCQHYNVPLDNAHDAAGDALASLLVARAAYKRYPELAAIAPDELLSRQQTWHIERQQSYADWLVSQRRNPIQVPKSWPIDVA